MKYEKKPSGSFNVLKIEKLEKVKEKRLKFNYDGNERNFDLKCKDEATRNKWFDTLSFLITVVEKIGDIDILRTSSTATYFSNNSDGKDEKKRPSSESHKFKNFDSETQKAVVKSEDALFSSKKE